MSEGSSPSNCLHTNAFMTGAYTRVYGQNTQIRIFKLREKNVKPLSRDTLFIRTAPFSFYVHGNPKDVTPMITLTHVHGAKDECQLELEKRKS